MTGILQVVTKKIEKPFRRNKISVLGNNPLFYKAMTVDKKIFKIKRRRWD